MPIDLDHRHGPKTAPAAGFTLVEMLVALTLVGFTAVLAFGGVRLGTRAWHKAEDISIEAEEIYAAQALLRRQISQSYPVYMVNSQGIPYVDFAGSGDQLTIVSPAPPPLAAGGFARMEFRLQDSATKKDLIVRSRLDLGEHAADNRNLPVLTGSLAHDVRAVRFRYFGSTRSDQPAQWRDDWATQPALPQLVKIEIAFVNPDKYWPDLVIPLRVDMDAGCVYDAVSRRCRGR